MTWLQAQQKRLITRFSIKQKLVSSGQIHTLSRLNLVPQILVGRDYCQYVCIRLGNVPKAKRDSALKHRIESLSMWPSTSYSVAWHQGDAQVWLWDSHELHNLPEQDETVETTRLYSPIFLSEVVYWKKPSQNGFHLFKCNHGYDLHCWNNGLLSASQWFSKPPTVSQIQRFARAQSLPSDSLNLAVEVPEVTNEPWSGVVTSVWEHFFERRSQIILGLAALSLLVASLQLTAIARWYWEAYSLQKQTAIVTESANELLAARSSARSAQLEINKLAQLLNVPDPLATHQKIHRHLPPKQQLVLQTWERNLDQVDMVVAGEIPDTLSLVRAFSQDGMKNVRVEPTAEANKYRIRLKLDGYTQIKAGATP